MEAGPREELSAGLCLNGLGKANFKRMVWDWMISKLLPCVVTSGDHLCASISVCGGADSEFSYMEPRS